MMHPALLTAALLTFLLAVLTLGMILGVNLGSHGHSYVPVGGTLRLPGPTRHTLGRLRAALYVLLLGTAALLWLAWLWRVSLPIAQGIRLT
ncbi:hypothetical protein DAETH_34560 (plasmid) [Deinococcus aetherius]|uniref:Uncharacterized protein n=1 Tax=Deinococcus aetherius TaxID=200252 RepID=A0ABM8AIG6_9DEIO|nr:hypothetical protein [Deinococcus aetherius]BDP43487.1 hypothetical protein DAETH_34560 [Deinococcus aetherius]